MGFVGPVWPAALGAPHSRASVRHAFAVVASLEVRREDPLRSRVITGVEGGVHASSRGSHIFGHLLSPMLTFAVVTFVWTRRRTSSTISGT